MYIKMDINGVDKDFLRLRYSSTRKPSVDVMMSQEVIFYLLNNLRSIVHFLKISRRNGINIKLKSVNYEFIALFTSLYMDIDVFSKAESSIFALHQEQCTHIIKIIDGNWVLFKTNGVLVECIRLVRIISRIDSLAKPVANLMNKLHDFINAENSPFAIKNDCIAIFSNISGCESMRKIMVDISLPKLVLGFMDYKVEPNFFTDICAAISNFSMFDDTASLLVKNNAMSKIINLLNEKRLGLSGKIQLCNVLSLIAKHGINHINNDVALQCIVELWMSNRSQLEVCTSCCNAIGNMASAEYRFSVHRKPDITSLILEGMKNWSESIKYLTTSCFAIAHLSYHDAICRRTFSKMNGVSMIIDEMVNFQVSRSLQATGCFALGSLMIHEKFRETFVENHGIDLILKTCYREDSNQKLSEIDESKVITKFQIDNSSTWTSSFTTDIEGGSFGKDREHQEETSDIPPSSSSKGLPSHLLIKMFASILFANLMETDAYLEMMIEKGVVLHLYRTAEKSIANPDLFEVIFAIFKRFTNQGKYDNFGDFTD